MTLRGVVRTAELVENPPGSERIEMRLQVQGVGPGQPRTLVVPFERLLDDPNLDPESVAGRSFAAEVSQGADGTWQVDAITLAGRVLRPGS